MHWIDDNVEDNYDNDFHDENNDDKDDDKDDDSDDVQCAEAGALVQLQGGRKWFVKKHL